MKKCILFSIVTLLCLNLYSQNWSQNWSPLSTGVSVAAYTTSCHVQCLVVYNNKLIVAGDFSSAGGNFANNIAAWDGTSWFTLGTGVVGATASIMMLCAEGSNSGLVTSMVVFNNELYVGGIFNNAGGIPVKNIAKWNGTAWSDVGGGVRPPQYSPYGVVNSLVVYNNELYVGGNFDTAGVIRASNIAKWNGSTWSSVGSGINGAPINNRVNTMVTLNTNLYVGGLFDTAGAIHVSNVAKWNGSTWSALGTGIPRGSIADPGVNCLTTYNNMVYAGNNTTGISKWNGTNWLAVGGGLGTGTLGAFTGTVFGTDLIIGGSFSSAGLTQNTFNIAKWNDTTWDHFGAPISGQYLGIYGCVSTLIVYNGSLYAGGSFQTENSMSTVQLNKIARFNGTVGINEYFNSELINIYPNPSSGMLNLDLPKEFKTCTISIYSSSGECIYNGKYTNQVDVSNFATGVYFLTIPTETGILRKGFVVEHK